PLDSLARALRPSTYFAAYGLGWGMSDYQGKKIVQHDGALDGMRSRIAMIPDEKLGVALLINASRATLNGAIMYRIFDYYLHAPERDWSAELLKINNEANAKEKADTKKKEDARVSGTRPFHRTSDYAGTYRSELYGDAVITARDTTLEVTF